MLYGFVCVGKSFQFSFSIVRFPPFSSAQQALSEKRFWSHDDLKQRYISGFMKLNQKNLADGIKMLQCWRNTHERKDCDVILKKHVFIQWNRG